MINGMSNTRMEVIKFMENDEQLSKLKNENWYMVENAICNFICKCFNINHNDALFSKCDDLMLDDHPTDFEEKIYRKVDRYYHKQDILACIDDDQAQREDNGQPRLVYQTNDIRQMLNSYEGDITGSENIQLARDTLYDYQCSNVLSEEK